MKDEKDEFDAHIAHRADDLERSGLSRDDAARRARAEFGNVNRYAAELRADSWRAAAAALPGQIGREITHAVRRLIAAPLFTIFAVISLGLSLGVTVSVYSLLSTVLWTRDGIPDPERLVFITAASPYGSSQQWQTALSRPDVEDLRSASTTLRDAPASARFYQALVGTDVSEIARGEAVTGNYFAVLGIGPALGRIIQPADDDPALAAVAVLSHSFWRAKFAGDPAVLGRLVRIGGQPFQVVGVTAETFGGLGDQQPTATDVWIPLAGTHLFTSNASRGDTANRSRPQLTIVTRVEDTRSVQAIAAEVAGIGRQLDSVAPLQRKRADGTTAPMPMPRAWSATTLAANRDASQSRALPIGAIIVGIVSLVLVVACTNLANLVLARGSSRTVELAVRRALGASRARLVREQLIESGILALLGGLCAFAVTRVLLATASGNVPVSSGRMLEINPQLNLPVLLMAGTALIVALVVFGLMPALQLSRAALRPAMAAESGSTGRLRWGSRKRLIGLQVAISTALFLIAIFFVRVVIAETRHDSGVDAERLTLGILNFRLAPWNETRARGVVDDLLREGVSQPGFDGLAVASDVPYGTTITMFAALTKPDKPFTKDGAFPEALFMTATPQIFHVLGVPILKGRAFDSRDDAGTEPVIVVSEFTAHQLFGTSHVVGRTVMLRNMLNMVDRTSVWTRTIVGVAADTDVQNVYSRNSGVVYVPFAQHYEPTLMLVARASDDPAAIVGPLRALVQRADPNLVLESPSTGMLMLKGRYVMVRVTAAFTSSLALLALVLAMVGLYGVLTHVVTMRTREVGLRMALGADTSRIMRLVLHDGLRPVIIGVACGLALGFAVRVVTRAVFQSAFSIEDIVVFSLAPLPLLAAAVVACFWPARRASRVQPIVALKDY